MIRYCRITGKIFKPGSAELDQSLHREGHCCVARHGIEDCQFRVVWHRTFYQLNDGIRTTVDKELKVFENDLILLDIF